VLAPHQCCVPLHILDLSVATRVWQPEALDLLILHAKDAHAWPSLRFARVPGPITLFIALDASGAIAGGAWLWTSVNPQRRAVTFCHAAAAALLKGPISSTWLEARTGRVALEAAITWRILFHAVVFLTDAFNVDQNIKSCTSSVGPVAFEYLCVHCALASLSTPVHLASKWRRRIEVCAKRSDAISDVSAGV
jgi:hypothetical protein